MMNLYNYMNYSNPSQYISGRIQEYDIRSANVSILMKNHIITEDNFNYLSKLPKLDREKEIGLLIKKDRKYYDIIQDGIKLAKKQLLISNQIQEDQVIRIANDAIYINTPYDLAHRIFDNIEFKIKSTSTVYLNFKSNLLFFIYIDLQNHISIDVKGIGKEKISLHEPLLGVIGYTVYLIERYGPKEAFDYINQFYQDYIQKQLDISFYRELNGFSCYRINSSLSQDYGISSPPPLEEVDISYNLSILRELWGIVFDLCHWN